MFFYELTHPDYISDMAHTRHNPVCILANEKVQRLLKQMVLVTIYVNQSKVRLS